MLSLGGLQSAGPSRSVPPALPIENERARPIRVNHARDTYTRYNVPNWHGTPVRTSFARSLGHLVLNVKESRSDKVKSQHDAKDTYMISSVVYIMGEQ